MLPCSKYIKLRLFISVDYIMGQWQAWSTCSATCSDGVCIRHRECEGGKEGGQDCPAQAEAEYKQVKICTPKKCSGTKFCFYILDNNPIEI